MIMTAIDPQTIYETCMAGKESGRISATDVFQFVRSPFALWCRWHVSEDLKDPASLFMQLLFEQGQEHEQRFVQESYPDAVRTEYETLPEGFLLALESVAGGTAVLHGAPLLYLKEDLLGVTDLLERSDTHASVFGPFHYRVKEIKLAKNIKDPHRLQGAFYNYLLGKVQRYTPETFVIVNRDGEVFEYTYDEAEFLEVLDKMERIARGESVSPTYGSCEWPWRTYCNQEAVRLNDVSIVPGIGLSYKANLVAAGIDTVDDLAAASDKQLKEIRGIGVKRANTMITAAKAVVVGEPIRIGSVTFPKAPVEIFLDLEGTGQQMGDDKIIAMDYLIGVVVRLDDGVRYLHFFAEDFDAEGKMIRSFIEWLKTQKDFIIYHWHSYEKIHLTRLLDKYGFPESEARLVLEALRDLYRIATRAFAFPTPGRGLKDIAGFLGFEWRHPGVDATESIALYYQYVKDPETYQDNVLKVLDYNEDDCLAAMIIKDWLSNHSGPLEA